ncbi:MAG: hypothetical protein U0V87_14145 [Acidobacteriota bacterium]
MDVRQQAIPATEEPPPVVKHWRTVYLLVVAELALLVLLFCLLKQWAS